MRIARLIPLCMILLPCACTQKQESGVKVYRLNTAVAPTAKPHPTPPPPHKHSNFHIVKNDDVWATDGEKHLEIDLTQQRGTFYIDGQAAMEFPVCTGRKGYETPTGTYTIKEKRRHHRSNLYHVSMPCFMRLTYDGIGLHVGEIRSTPASHGCIRLPHEACLPIFHAVSPGTKVVIY